MASTGHGESPGLLLQESIEPGENRATESIRDVRFGTAFDRMPLALGITTLDEGRFLAANRLFESILGWTREEILGRTSTELGIWADPADREETVARLKTGEPVRELLVRFRRRDGALRWITYSAERVELDGVACLLSGLVDVTDRRHAEEQLAASEARARTMLETAFDGVWLTDEGGNFLDVNEAACRMLGYTREELLRLQVSDLEAIETAEETQAHLEQVRRKGADRFESVHVRKDGSRIPVDVSVTFLGEQHQMVVFVRDLSAQDRAELALRRSEARLRAIFDTEPECVKIVSPEGLLLDMNPAGLAMLEVDRREEAIGKPVVAMVVPEHRQRFLEIAARAFREGAATGAFEIVGKKGTRRWMDTHAVPLTEAPGQPPVLLAVTRDTTARMRAEAALQESEARYRMLSENIVDVIWLLDIASARFEYVSPSVERLRGLSPDEVVAEPMESSVTRESAAKVHRLIAERVDRFDPADPATWSFVDEIDQLRRDGSVVPTEVTTRYLADAAGRPAKILGVTRDITERRQAELERRGLEQQVARAQKLESLGSLAGGVAHDINNVLAAILSLATVHQLESDEGSPLRQSMDTIAQACLRGRTLVQGLLGFARQGVAEQRQVDLNAIVREEVGLLERATLQKVILRMELDERLRSTRGDPAALGHALMNLCVNAVDAMPDGGVLTLRTRNEGSREVLLEVIDTGCGMTREVQEKALDPFFTTKPQGKGTGLGLSIVYGAVKAHGGRMEIRSAPGRGTTVSIRLPASDAAEAESPRAAGPPRPARSLRVLVVDDDELIQRSLGRLLKALGHQPTVVSRGEEGLELLEKGFECDVVVLDLNMPGLGGAATLGRLRSLRPELPVLLATGRADQDAMDLAARTPKVSLLAKPFTLQEVSAELDAIA